jgi:hypothetical protein
MMVLQLTRRAIMALKDKFIVRLTREQRRQLERELREQAGMSRKALVVVVQG